ncbi:hypothetical protein [Aestuariispira insulae]|uniref:Exosortase/archaeosortase family protein n=1 Tax=Aestuariispira insulae TaxID=1461337 RepID=A0A3D9H2S8_9PROT|nr:hypothetical protein [Aestuariispira insulae]RED43794.1 hypothetical protein DFP90_11817 [Aestuariispira insulae]
MMPASNFDDNAGFARLSLLVIAGCLLNGFAKPFLAWLTAPDIVDQNLGQHLFGIQPVTLFAALLGLWQLLKSPFALKPSRADLWVAIIVMALCLLPFARTAWFALALFSGWACFRLKGNAQGSETGYVILLAVSLRDPISVAMLDLFSDGFLTFDAWASGSLLNLFGDTITVQSNMFSNSDGHSVYVLTGCASFKDISFGLLIWFSVIRTSGSRPLSFWFSCGAALALCLMFINIVRLALMGLSPAHYSFIHDGTGAQIFQGLLITIIFLWILIGNRHAKPA